MMKFIGIGFILAILFYLIKSFARPKNIEYMSHDAHDDEDIESLAKNGHKVSAVKAYMNLHGVSLKEAKQAIDLMLQDSFHEDHHVDDSMSLTTDEKILRIAQSGHKIQAIKIYRETYHVGLKQAKEAVENLLKLNQ